MGFQLVSDLHLELDQGLNAPLPEARAPTLVMAGDIGQPQCLEPLLRDVCSRWQHVLYVPGNHEYYNKKSSKERVFAELKALEEQFANLRVMDMDVIKIGNQRYVGCTLWSSPVSPDGFNDFKRIRTQVLAKRHPINIFTMRQWNIEARAFLEATVQPGDVVITHFMPGTTKDLIEAGHRSMYDSCYSQDLYFGNKGLEHIITRAAVWVSGHTHQAFDVEFCGTRWVCNPFGYPGERTNARFEDLVIEPLPPL